MMREIFASRFEIAQQKMSCLLREKLEQATNAGNQGVDPYAPDYWTLQSRIRRAIERENQKRDF